MEFSELKRKSLTGIGSLLQRQILGSGIMFLGNIILARILMPQVFGIYAIVAFIVQFFSIFSDVGIGASLIQKKERLNAAEVSTLFWLQQMLALALAVIVFAAAPLALRVYPSLPEVSVWLIRSMAVTFLLTSLKTVPAILMERDLNFQRIAIVEISEAFVFQATAITLALAGFDVWSFIIAALLRGLIGAVLIYSLSSWRPSRLYQPGSVKELLRFGLPYQGTSILSFIKDSVTPLFVGAYVGAAAVGYVNWARDFAYAPLVLSQSFGRVAFPSFAKLQHDKARLKDAIERSIRMITFVMFPITAIMMVFAPDLIRIIFSEKWLPGITAYYFYCISPAGVGIFMPLGNAIFSLGLSHIYFFLTIVLVFFEWGFGIPLILKFGFAGVAMTLPITVPVFTYLYWRILRSQGVSINIFRNIGWQFAAACISSAFVSLLYYGLFPYKNYALIFIPIASFFLAAIYLAILRKYQKSLLDEFQSYIKDIFTRNPTAGH